MKVAKEGENMTYAVAINRSGQATIPKAIREALSLVPGENRLIFEKTKEGQVILKREKSRREMLEESLEKIWAITSEEEKKNPEFAKNRRKYAGMTFNEVRDAYDATPEGKKEFNEKYGFEI